MTNNFILSLLTGNLDYKSAYGVEELALPIRGLLLPDEGAVLLWSAMSPQHQLDAHARSNVICSAVKPLSLARAAS